LAEEAAAKAEAERKKLEEDKIKAAAAAKEQAEKKRAEEQKIKEAEEKERLAKEKAPEEMIPDKIDENMASNNWVIHGNFTKTGKPLLAGDPHLGNQLPSHWYLMEMTYDDITISGATHPGIPFHMFGKTPHMTWAITSALTDLSDLYREKLSDDKKKYLVDG
jgi:penicillin amidase